MGIIKREPTMKEALAQLNREISNLSPSDERYYAPKFKSEDEDKRHFSEPPSPAPAPLTKVEELAVLCRLLTYGEMMIFAEGIANKGIQVENNYLIAGAIHDWAKNYSGE